LIELAAGGNRLIDLGKAHRDSASIMTARLFQLLALISVTTVVSGQTLPAPWGDPVWSDEFDGKTLDTSKWTYDTGGAGWGNNELEFYTDRPTNSYISQGCLVLEARKESFNNRSYTSARIKTQGLQSWTYGRIEARINIPGGQGVWPAFWMLGTNISTVGWPACGEIDIMEHVLPIGANTVRGSAHGPNFSAGNSVHGDATVASLTGEFHVYAVEWEPTEIRWYIDGRNYFSATPQSVKGTWVFDRPFFLIFNLAIGGGWPGAPDRTTTFPARMLVDYVRVYQSKNLGGPKTAVRKPVR
jgi:beta-glucanase (GH16 family)